MLIKQMRGMLSAKDLLYYFSFLTIRKQKKTSDKKVEQIQLPRAPRPTRENQNRSSSTQSALPGYLCTFIPFPTTVHYSLLVIYIPWVLIKGCHNFKVTFKETIQNQMLIDLFLPIPNLKMDI